MWAAQPTCGGCTDAAWWLPCSLEPGVGMGLDTLPWSLVSGLDPTLDGWTPEGGCVGRLVPAACGWPGC